MWKWIVAPRYLPFQQFNKLAYWQVNETALLYKESLEKQLETLKNTEMESGEQTVANGDDEIVNGQHERTTFNTSEIEKHTKFLEKEKGLLEKELTRVQEECNNLKVKLEPTDRPLLNQCFEQKHKGTRKTTKYSVFPFKSVYDVPSKKVHGYVLFLAPTGER